LSYFLSEFPIPALTIQKSGAKLKTTGSFYSTMQLTCLILRMFVSHILQFIYHKTEDRIAKS